MSDTSDDHLIGAFRSDDEIDGDGLSLRKALFWAQPGDTDDHADGAGGGSARCGQYPVDGRINEFLMIDGIRDYPENRVLVFNRNGTLVWEAKGYDNQRVMFRGIGTGQQQLPAHTIYSGAEGQRRLGVPQGIRCTEV